MQLTIDSSEPLDHVLRVVESLYGVELSATTKPTAPRPKRVSAAKKAAKPATASRQSGARTSAKTDPAIVRNWARANGHTVRDRGRVPASVLAAYKSSTKVTK